MTEKPFRNKDLEETYQKMMKAIRKSGHSISLD